MPIFANFEDHEEIDTQTPDHTGNTPNTDCRKSINRLSKIILAAKNFSVRHRSTLSEIERLRNAPVTSGNL